MSKGVVVFIKKDGKYLFIEEARELLRGHWAPPHGRLEAGEGEEDAVRREVLEEVGLVVAPLRLIASQKADTKVKTVSFWEAEYISGDVEVDSEEVSNYGWYSVEEAVGLKLFPGTAIFLKEHGKELK